MRGNSSFVTFATFANMTGRWQPYLYQPQKEDMIDPTQPTFNPKAVTMASRIPPSPRKKQEGPLINFNKHPDSYLIMPYGNTDAKPLNKRTKTFIQVARSVQLFFRVCALLGAVGVLLCGIFIRGALDTEGYIMRIPVCTRWNYTDTWLTCTARCGHCDLPVCYIPPSSQCEIATSG